MANQIFYRLSPKTLTLHSFLSRSLSTTTLPSFLLRRRSLSAFAVTSCRVLLPNSLCSFSTRATTSSLNDPNPNWSNRPPKETILLDGCDFEHWLVVMEKPEGDPTRDEIIDGYIKTLTQVIGGSEEEARMKIYSVSTRHYFAFGALVSEELSYKLKGIVHIRWVLPDSYLNVKEKDYGGEPFINGQVVPYDPKYHEESRNFDKRRENVVNRDMQTRPPMQNPGPNMVGPPHNAGGFPPNNAGGYAPAPPSNQGGYAPPNAGEYTPNNTTGGYLPPNMGGPPPNMGRPPPPPNSGYGMPQNNYPGNMGGVPENQNMGGFPPNAGWGNNQ
ncbi:hypothetical protein RYX36_009993 [Vicia faba]